MPMTISGSNGLTFPDTSTQSSGKQVCKAWVNFNGTGTPAIRDSFNVSSITDNGTGDYTINFTNAMANANYCATLAFSRDPDCPSGNIATNNATGGNVAPTTTALRVGMFLFGVGGKDVTYVNVAVFSA